jgi:hypothetical protein
MQRTTSMTGISHDLTQNRQDAVGDTYRYVVVSQRKDGRPAKVTASDLQWSGRKTYAEAEHRKHALEQMNPGKTFVIITRSYTEEHNDGPYLLHDPRAKR